MSNNQLYAKKPEYWASKWMKLPDYAGGNIFVKARRIFKVSDKIKDAHIYISARMKYRLWINGSYIGEGPARSGVEQYCYDSYDVTEHIKTGENVIGIIVNHYSRLPHAFIAQLEILDTKSDKIIIASDDEYKVTVAEEYTKDTPLYAFADYSEVYNDNLTTKGWLIADYDDTAWSRAEYLDPFNTQKTKRKAPIAMPFSNIIPRNIPQIKQNVVWPKEILEVGECPVWRQTNKNYGAYMMGEIHLPINHCQINKSEFCIQKNDDVCTVSRPPMNCSVDEFKGLFDPYIVIDFGKLMNAYVVIEAEARDGKGITIDVGYSDRMYYGRAITEAYTDMCSADRVILSEDAIRWQSFYWRQFRYVQLSLRNLNADLKIKRVYAIECEYPFMERGRFQCDLKELNTIWDMTHRTIKLCTYDNFMDNGLREKQPWTGDISVIALGAFAMFGDDPVIRRYFSTNIHGQRKSGVIPGHWPETSIKAHSVTEEGNILWFEHPLALMVRVSEYYRYGGYKDFVESFAPHIRRYLQLFDRYENLDGLLEEIPGKHWVDWAALNMKGIAFITNVWYSEILLFASELLADDTTFAETCKAKAEHIRTYLKENCWIEERGLFADSIQQPGEQTFSEHSNYTALLYGLVPEDRVDILIKTMESTDIIRVEPSFMYPAIMGLMKNGRVKEAIAMIKARYRVCFEAGYETIPEEWHPNATYRNGKWQARIRALAQAASCGLPFAFLEGILGVTSLGDGYKRFHVKPAIDAVERCEGTVPTSMGDITVAWQTEGRTVELTVTCPEYAVGTLEINNETTQLVAGNNTFTIKR